MAPAEPGVADSASKGARLRALLRDEHPLVLPGVFNGISALAAQASGARAVYISGAGVINGAGYPDIGLLSMAEVAQQLRYIAGAVAVPALADADTGFGEGLALGRTVEEFERAGVAGIHIEDQQMPKKCGHLDGKRLVTRQEFVQRIKAAVRARTDPHFVICARTDARAVSGFADAVDRARACLDAGADLIFPEALQSEDEFAAFATQVQAPLLANMTEFGRSPRLDCTTLAALGYRIILYPVTLLRVALRSAQETLTAIRQQGHQWD
ncbi:MAG TPA: isocitrate lyase/phosphoenolpyruvate mutase family protein, partial [Chloroflexota bacterium]|nr:isocitrate lyase/phosphoenolpyruvate mutase family protein [Chloroflexota bacterium]